MDCSHAVRQTQYDRVCTCSADYLKWTEVFFSKLLRGSGRAEELSLNKGRRTEGEFGMGGSGLVCRDLITGLGLSDVILQGRMQLVKVNGELAGSG